MGFFDLFKNVSFLCKFIAMICLLVSTLFSLAIDDSFGALVEGNRQIALWYHAMGGYNIILVAFVLLYIIDEIPGVWAQRILVVVGAILLLVSGLIGIINVFKNNGKASSVCQAICLIAAGVCLVIDFIKTNFLSHGRRTGEQSNTEGSAQST